MKLVEAVRKLGRAVWWRLYVPLVHPRSDSLATRWGALTRFVRWPLPGLAPYRQRELHIERNVGLGDVLMCTPAMREVKRLNPDCKVTFYTDWPQLVDGLPFIDHVRAYLDPSPPRIWLHYEKKLPPKRHVARILGDHLGVNVRDVRPACVLDPSLCDAFKAEWAHLPRPWVVIVRRASGFTFNKNWPDEYWETLVDWLLTFATVIELGAGDTDRRARSEANFVDLFGRTTVPELVAATAAADFAVVPDTGVMHIAAAVGTPAVVIYGGYTDPGSLGYPGNVDLYNPVECAPCWIKTPCPYGKKCLHQITPEQVQTAVDGVWAGLREQGSAKVETGAR
jgi:ADP-heptose:LPS heptosyltransferase